MAQNDRSHYQCTPSLTRLFACAYSPRAMSGNTSQEAPAHTAEKTLQAQQRRGGSWVILALFAGSILIGVVSYYQFMRSEELLHKDFAEMRTRGAQYAVEQCVDEVLLWHTTCEAMGVLCDKSVGRMMEMCLDGRDRTSYCASLDLTESHTSGYGYKECAERGMHAGKQKRKKKKVCGTAYRAVAYHCQQIQSKLGPTSTAEVTR